MQVFMSATVYDVDVTKFVYRFRHTGLAPGLVQKMP